MGDCGWREIMAVIRDGGFLMCRAVLPVMVAGGGGTIVNIGGVSAHIGAKNRAHVSAAKAGIVGLTKALAVERSEEHTSELQSLMRISYAVFCLKKKRARQTTKNRNKDKMTHTKHLT